MVDRPNVVFILSDDQGPWALGCAGNPEIRTPVLDRLAAAGIRFDNFFCTSPVCSAARASLLTGKIPSQHGVHDWIREGNGSQGVEYLRDQVGYTDILAAHGWHCGISGKWHLGNSYQPQKSFSHWYVHEKGSDHYYNAPMIRHGRLVKEPQYVTDLITDDAIDFIRGTTYSQPFYLSVHYTAPHGPWIGEHPEEYVQLYSNCPFSSCPQEPTHPHAMYRYEPEDARACLQGYYAAVTAMDAQIGRIINVIEERGLLHNTLVCFLSDNGFNCGHHGIWGKGNGTYPLNLYDTSVKVPAIFCHPGTIPGGRTSSRLVSGYDFMPTLLEYLGITWDDKTKPGTSFAAELRGRGLPSQEQVVIYDEYGSARMVRTQRYKYVHYYGGGSDALFDMGSDPEERCNRVNDPGLGPIRRKMHQQLQRWFKQYVDPEFDGKYLPVRGNGQLGVIGTAAPDSLFDQNRHVMTSPETDPGFRLQPKPRGGSYPSS